MIIDRCVSNNQMQYLNTSQLCSEAGQLVWDEPMVQAVVGLDIQD